MRTRLASLVLTAALLVPHSALAAEAHGGFVRANGTELELNGGAYYFSGANSYSMLYSERHALEQYEEAEALGLNALRIWGFWNGEATEPLVDEEGNVIREPLPDRDRYGRWVLQSRPRVYPEPAWQRLDYVIYLAHVYDMKLIVPLMNQWIEFGGLEQYMEWGGIELPEEREGFYATENAIKAMRDEFWASSEARDLYFDYVAQMLERVNTFTGVKYKDDPAIMIWEVMNEPRFGPWGGDKSATIVRDFLAEAAAFIKSIDPNHLVGTGEEGFLNRADSLLDRETYPWTAASGEGVSFVLNAQIPEIDVLGFHCWPFQWSLWGSSEDDFGEDVLGEYPDIADFGPEWVREHVRIANEIGKPSYLGEFGFQILRRPGSTVEDRNRIMQAIYDAARDTNLAGIAYWHITADDDPSEAVYSGPLERNTLLQAQYVDDVVPHDLDFRFDIYCPADESTCGIISEFSEFMTARVQNPDPPFEPPCLEPRTRCDVDCVLLESHPEHCGACGAECALDERCASGACVPLAESVDESTLPPDEDPGCSTSRTDPSSPWNLWGFILAMPFFGRALRRRSTEREAVTAERRLPEAGSTSRLTSP